MKSRIKSLVFFIALSLSLQLALPTTLEAQCPMCKMSAEQNLKDGGTAGKGLNAGILYMFMSPYIIIGCIGYFWYRNRKPEVE